MFSDDLTDTITQPRREIYSISRLNREARQLLEGNFPLIWVEGEISNFARPGSGHWYFSLKDASAQVRCAMFRNRNQLLRFTPENGSQVLVRAKVSLFEGRGEFQLIIEHMEEAGDGALRRAFEELKQKLATEGLFDPAQKKGLPTLPRCIGIVTSPTGAAIRDILSVLGRRFPSIPVIIYPTAVQGTGAGSEIARAIQIANQRQECDVLLVSRGGGSLEDLWAFNEEVVARAIYASELPVVSGVGHEIDFTIADFVADQRAPTPSAAAEMLSPDQTEWRAGIEQQLYRLVKNMEARLRQLSQRIDWLQKRLQQQHPGYRLLQLAQRLDGLEQGLLRAMVRLREKRQHRLHQLEGRLLQYTPAHRLHRYGEQHQHLSTRLQRAMQRILQEKKQTLMSLARTMDTISPLATLDRGYSILSTQEGKVIRSADEVQPGDRLKARLSKGRLSLRVEDITKKEDEES